jgi:hypothetical protein
MSIDVVSPLRERMIRGHDRAQARRRHAKTPHQSCKRFAAFLQRSPDTATVEDIRRFQLHLAKTETISCNATAS